jgi:ABC-type antimicrobial peptide transport system permease subunit
MQFFLRAEQDSASLATSVRSVVRAMDSEALIRTRTLDEIVGGTIARPRAISILVGVFALIALALAAVGVYGVMAYSVRERTQEIGIRMALGATATSVFRLVVAQALRLVCLGVAGGLIAAAALTRLLERLLYDVQPLDPWTFAGSALLLLVVATIASYVPARRGMKMAPVDALRTN